MSSGVRLPLLSPLLSLSRTASRSPVRLHSKGPPLCTRGRVTRLRDDDGPSSSSSRARSRVSACVLHPPLLVCSPGSFAVAFDAAPQHQFLFEFLSARQYVRCCRSLAPCYSQGPARSDGKELRRGARLNEKGTGSKETSTQKQHGQSKCPGQEGEGELTGREANTPAAMCFCLRRGS